MQKTSSRRPPYRSSCLCFSRVRMERSMRTFTDYRKQAVCQAAFCHDAAKGRRAEATRGDQRSPADAPSPEGTQFLGECSARCHRGRRQVLTADRDRVASQKQHWPSSKLARSTLAAVNAGWAGKKPTTKVQSAPFAICTKPYRPDAAPIICVSVLIALVIAIGADAPTPMDRTSMVPSTEATLSIEVAETRKNSAAPNTAIALV